jgi:hypothetical protein
MDVKSRFGTEDEDVERDNRYMRAGCGAPYSMTGGPTRLDVSTIHAPKFIRMIFRALGWKTESDNHQKY